MITILKKPYQCSFTKNPIEFEVFGSMKYNSPAVMPILRFMFLNKCVNGKNINFEFTNPETLEVEKINLVFGSTYNLPNVLPDNTTAGSLTDYVKEVAKRLAAIQVLNAWYTVEFISTPQLEVHLVAKEPIEELVIKNLAFTVSGFNCAIQNKTNYNLPLERDGYSLKAIVHVENEYLSGNYTSTAALNCYADADAISKIDISNILDSEIESGMDSFPIPIDHLKMNSGLLKRYYVEFIEEWNDQTNPIRTVSPVFFSAWGGVSVNDQRLGDPMLLLQMKSKFLTWWPSGKQLFKKQNDWLSWMNTIKDGTYKYVLRVYKNTGPVNYPVSGIVLKKWESLTIPVGYTQRDLDSILGPGESIVKWGFYITTDSDKVVSDEMIYYLNESNCSSMEVLVYNSFGMPETFGVVNMEETNTISSELVTQSNSFNNNRLKPDIFVFESTHQDSLIATTTRLQKEEAFRLKSILNSMIAFVWRGERWVPAVMTVEKKKTRIESAFTMILDVEMLIATTNDRASFYDAVPVISAVEQCGIPFINIETNGIEIEDFGTLTVTKDGAAFGSANWDGSKYIPTPAINTEGIYEITGEVYGLSYDTAAPVYQVLATIDYRWPVMQCSYSNTGPVDFTFKSSNPIAQIQIDYGTGDGWTINNYTSSGTYISIPSLTDTGRKIMSFRKACFDDIIWFASWHIDLIDIELLPMKNLQKLTIYEAQWSGNVYLNGLTKLQEIELKDVPFIGIELGIMPKLVNLKLENSLMDQASVDSLIDELWTNRKHFENPCTVLISGTGLTWSTESLKKINGTDEYVGEGLTTEYSFTLTIS